MAKLVLPQKIMIIRHAEKPAVYGDKNVIYAGVNEVGGQDNQSLVSLGWERAGALAGLFSTTANGPLRNPYLAQPTVIYAADPCASPEPSQRPCQTISALASKLGVIPNIKFAVSDFKDMVSDALGKKQESDVVLICWQHEDILPKKSGNDGIVMEIAKQTKSSLENLPGKPWPGERYDMVLVFDQPSGKRYTRFTQVPQLLLAGDVATPFK